MTGPFDPVPPLGAPRGRHHHSRDVLDYFRIEGIEPPRPPERPSLAALVASHLARRSARRASRTTTRPASDP